MLKTIFIFILYALYCRADAEIKIKKSDLNIPAKFPIQINKVSLTQKGYIQFLRYLTDIPPIEDFTFCIWLKSSNLTYNHPLLSYSRHETDRFIRAWVTPNGKEIKLALREKEIFSVNVGLQEYQWYHICPSWSSKTGHWDLYLDGKLKAHGFREKARGLILPKHGDLVVGQEYTDFDKGLDDGIEGDIFGFNMVLSSTAPKSSFSKIPFRFNRRRFTPLERRMDEGFIVSSPTLTLIRKSREAKGELNNHQKQRNVTYEDIVIEKEDPNVGPYFISEISANNKLVYGPTNRNKRQNYLFYPTSYSNFNFEPNHPVLRNMEQSYLKPRFPQYAIRYSHLPTQYMAPPRKTSRIANDLIPFTNVNPKPLGLQLIEMSYNCVLGKGAPLKNVLVSWTKTPVRVFGGAILKKIDPFCIKTEISV